MTLMMPVSSIKLTGHYNSEFLDNALCIVVDKDTQGNYPEVKLYINNNLASNIEMLVSMLDVGYTLIEYKLEYPLVFKEDVDIRYIEIVMKANEDIHFAFKSNVDVYIKCELYIDSTGKISSNCNLSPNLDDLDLTNMSKTILIKRI